MPHGGFEGPAGGLLLGERGDSTRGKGFELKKRKFGWDRGKINYGEGGGELWMGYSGEMLYDEGGGEVWVGYPEEINDDEGGGEV